MARIVDVETDESFDLDKIGKEKVMLGRLKDAKYKNDIGLYPSADDNIIDREKYLRKLSGVSREGHITLNRKSDGWYVVPKEGRLVCIGDFEEEISSETKLENGIRISLGVHKYELVFEAPTI